jgi:hypothetical protein
MKKKRKRRVFLGLLTDAAHALGPGPFILVAKNATEADPDSILGAVLDLAIGL